VFAPFKPLKVGLVTTGKEIAEGRVEDAFADKFRGKLETFKGELIGQRFCTDDASLIAAAIRSFLTEGAQLVVCTGGMSVDADDRTPGAIREVATRVAFQGLPLLPGAMALLAWVEQEGQEPCALIGAPACVVHDERTALDRLLPYVFCRCGSREFHSALGCRRFVRAVPRLPLAGLFLCRQ
jgi:molybdenum cofactor cytidylyltransferase